VIPAGSVPAARFRARRGRYRSYGTRRTASAASSEAVPARIAVIRASSAGGLGAAAEIRLIVLEDGRRLRVDAEEISRLRLEPGLVLDPPTLASLESRDAYRRAREAALRLLGARPRSTAELRARLHRAGAPADAAASVIADLTRDGYLDDLEFARAWVRSRMAIRPCGLQRLRSELREKGVASALIEQAIREVHGEEEAAVVEERCARRLVERRLRAYARLAWEVRVRRLAGMLQRRGFAAPTIARVLRTVQRQEAAKRPEVLRQTGSDRGDTQNA
jgi:regulatory protein